MRKINQDVLDKLTSRMGSNKNVHGAVFHVESIDKSISLFASTGSLTKESQYYIASINKLIISFITLRFCQNNLIQLSNRIADYLPKKTLKGLLIIDGIDFSNEITIQHLISHTSGLPCYLIDKRPDGKKNMDLILSGNAQSWPIDKVFDEIKQMKPKFKPGTKGKASYSETNFRILGKVLEHVSGKSIRELMTAIFLELEMNKTFVLSSDLAYKCATIFHKQDRIDISGYWDSTNHDVASTAEDQMKFLRAFFEGGFFSNEFIQELKQWNSIFFPFKYGIGIQKFYIPRILSPFKSIPEIIGHCGSVGSIAYYVPAKGVYITGTVNQTSNPNIVFQTLIKIINQL